MRISESVGHVLGAALAPVVALAARARHARMFHPSGVTYTGQFTPADGPYSGLAERLGPVVLARFSPALWKGDVEHFDVLGLALRFRHGSLVGVETQAGDQDLLFATIERPIYLGLGPFLTNAHDFLANKYFATSPFQPDTLDHRVYLRAVPLAHRQSTARRAQRLAEAVSEGAANLAIEARQTWTRTWHRLGTLVLASPIELDQAALRFDPFRSGAGLEPVGLVHAIRRSAYAASQHARPDHA